uniref:Putative ring finger n=1 Tax=Xenopsylla cheopis TaxID=163159 RepID=A0A6M2DY72_XENCH
MSYPGLLFGAGLVLAVGLAAYAFLFGNKVNTPYGAAESRYAAAGEYIPSNTWDDDETRRRRARTCSICLESMREGQCTLITKCNHLYHRICLNLWLRTNSSCPLCREQISSGDLNQC